MGRSILIADDEELIRKGLIARLSYLGFQFDTILEADDGVSAISLLDQREIDIIITDIKMTTMDGLKMIQKAKETHPDTQFVILSGYAEFEYAEEAIRLGVASYLLKPVSNDELKKVLHQILEKLDKIDQQKELMNQNQRNAKENQAFVFEKKMNELLRCAEWQKAKHILDSYDSKILQGENTKALVAVIGIDMESYEKRHFEYKDIDLIRFTIRNIFEEQPFTLEHHIVNSLADSSQLYVMIVGTQEDKMRQEAEKSFEMLHNSLWSYSEIIVTMGVSTISSQIYAERLREAQEAFLQRVIHGSGNLFFYDDIKILSAEKFPVPELHLLQQYIERHDIGNIQFIINDILSDECVAKYNVNYIRVMWIRILNILMRAANTESSYSAEQLELMMSKFEYMAQNQSLEEIRNYLFETILNGMEEKDRVDVNAKDKIKMAIHYIKDNYNQDIAINDLAEHFYMSPNYFSTVFKKETGQTTVNYIKSIRLEKAKKYLEESDKSVVDISKEVGYEDSQYFFKIFKKETGITPLQYRRFAQINDRS